ncbi:MAG: hypothetical protein AMXMBFR36_27850 [Acidobacteriota bacterium]
MTITPGSVETAFTEERCPLGSEPHLARRSERLDYFCCAWCEFYGTHAELLDRIADEAATAIASWGEMGLTGSPAHRARMTATARRLFKGGFDEPTAARMLEALAAFERNPITATEALAIARLGRALEAPAPTRRAA